MIDSAILAPQGETDRHCSLAVVADVRELVGPRAPIDEALVAAAVRGWSANTRRAFRSDLTLWGKWCRQNRIAADRADAALVASWIRALAGIDDSSETQRAMATIERYIVNVGWAYRMAGLPDPTSMPLVRLEKKAARKALGVKQRQARAIASKAKYRTWTARPWGYVSLISSERAGATNWAFAMRHYCASPTTPGRGGLSSWRSMSTMSKGQIPRGRAFSSYLRRKPTRWGRGPTPILRPRRWRRYAAGATRPMFEKAPYSGGSKPILTGL